MIAVCLEETWDCWEPYPVAVRRTQPRFRPTLGPSGTAGRVHFPLPPEDISSSTARGVWASRLPQVPRHSPTRRSWRSPTCRPGPPVTCPTPPPPPPIKMLSMLRVQPPFARRLEPPGRKQARIEFVAATWEVDVETQAGERTPAVRISFPCAVHMTRVQLKDGQQLVGLYTYWLPGGHGKLETAVSGEAGGG